ncbi:UDP-N-acetylglucosamine 1-carboxyvinyltransferase [Sphingomicrobium aestuariivivum]|uniref:UDP-N-acetylglucosamine 1-carboxyvinyltransferase n=1 Tax=Sphingomicrobium aestuariivivum TaxID=1582356 RepID=UPI001FD697BF|nr:UDP-N-acetylglucosamine 1-carboxyvinyltransferase [Sphingomicrobium aestuariivivum]MCJ8191525.1 UDP-N-acetylglucosamine 1-carboxyvinyltransferase [Sphingomicrobium aestuariivivum]
MDSIWIEGGKRLEGKIPISGAKNAVLTLIPCALLTEEKLTLSNLPRLADVDSFSHLMNELGVGTAFAGKKGGRTNRAITLDASHIDSTVAPYELVRKMRASILVLGPMLARMGESTVSLPGGCAIGDRPIELHLRALEAMGAEIELAEGYVKAIAPGGKLPGGEYTFPVVSVGATENAVMAATLCTGTTHLLNAAREPEIVDLCNCLVAMGAKIDGIGTSHLSITGVEALHGADYAVMPDRIEAGSYACAAGITGGSIELVGARASDMLATTNALAAAGLLTEFTDEGIKVSATGKLRPLAISTAPYPGFATDMQAQFMAMMTLADGDSYMEETIFENRYMHVPELRRMGAEIETRGRSAIVRGVEGLTGAKVMATDLRASMSLVLAGLAAKGETEVLRVYHLDRGYERLEEKLAGVGATIERRSGG